MRRSYLARGRKETIDSFLRTGSVETRSTMTVLHRRSASDLVVHVDRRERNANRFLVSSPSLSFSQFAVITRLDREINTRVFARVSRGGAKRGRVLLIRKERIAKNAAKSAAGSRLPDAPSRGIQFSILPSLRGSRRKLE